LFSNVAAFSYKKNGVEFELLAHLAVFSATHINLGSYASKSHLPYRFPKPGIPGISKF